MFLLHTGGHRALETRRDEGLLPALQNPPPDPYHWSRKANEYASVKELFFCTFFFPFGFHGAVVLYDDDEELALRGVS